MCYDFKECTEICISQLKNVHTVTSRYKFTEYTIHVVLTSNIQHPTRRLISFQGQRNEIILYARFVYSKVSYPINYMFTLCVLIAYGYFDA